MIGTSCLAFRRSALSRLLPIPETLRSQAEAYLTALIIFVALVVALSEFLAKYRLHGSNLFHAREGEAARGRIEHRIEIRSALLTEVRKWIERNMRDVASSELEAHVKQWTKSRELGGLELHKPSNWRYFRHLWEFPRVYGEIMSPWHGFYSLHSGLQRFGFRL
ncbi:MAG: hypothetical protein WA639_17735 [Candidatus Acidiferrum sp.]